MTGLKPAICFVMVLVVVATAAGRTAEGHDLTVRSDDYSLSSLQRTVQHQATTIQTLQAELTAATKRLSALEHNFHTHDNKISAIQQTQAKAAAFSVQFSQDDSVKGIPLTTHATLVFDDVLYNLGNGYNSRTGIFTAPTRGTYVFFLNAMSVNDQHYLNLQLMKEGRPVDLIYAQGGSDDNDQGSTEVTLHLSAGQQVWVRQYRGDNVRGGYRTIFTGFLLHAD